MADPVYEVVDLVKIYPQQSRPANDHITLTVRAGEVFGLLGDNGAGKTTLVRQMVNLLASTSGQIRLFGRPLDDAPLRAPSRVGYMPQSGFAFNNLTVAEALYYTAHLRGMPRRAAQAERDRLIALWDLDTARDQVAQRLSGGQKRLLLLAAAMAASPPVLILDEPTNDLDPQHRALAWDILRRINAEGGATLVLVTHNVAEAERVIQRVGILRGGRLIAEGRPGALKAGLNRQLRLDVTFDPRQPPRLPRALATHPAGPGRWLALIDRAEAADFARALAADPAVEDFRLGTATLEDLYLSLVK